MVGAATEKPLEPKQNRREGLFVYIYISHKWKIHVLCTFDVHKCVLSRVSVLVQEEVRNQKHTIHSGGGSTNPSNALPRSMILSLDSLKVFMNNISTPAISATRMQCTRVQGGTEYSGAFY